MTTALKRLLLVVVALVASTLGVAGTLTITSPTANAFLGKAGQISFTLAGSQGQSLVRATLTAPNGTTSIVQNQFTPDANGRVSGVLTTNLSASSPEGAYSVTVSATEANTTYDPQTVAFNVDVTSPKFLDFSPNVNGFVRGVVPVRATLLEPNVRDWKVTVNGADIPNNTGTGNSIAVDWDTASIQNDGTQTILLTVTDQAGNTASQSVSVTLDRVAPVVTISYPRSDTRLLSGATVTIIIDLQDFSNTSVDRTGVDVVVKGTDGAFIARGSLVSFRATGSNAYRWLGRIGYRTRALPSQFTLTVTATDRAGNVSTPQTVSLSTGRRR